jgi:hypothetical protein
MTPQEGDRAAGGQEFRWLQPAAVELGRVAGEHAVAVEAGLEGGELLPPRKLIFTVVDV